MPSEIAIYEPSSAEIPYYTSHPMVVPYVCLYLTASLSRWNVSRFFITKMPAAYQAALNRRQAQLLPGNSQTILAFEFAGLLLLLSVLSFASLDYLKAAAYPFRLLSW